MGSMSDWEWQLEPTYDGLLQAIESMNCGVTVENEDGLIFYVNARVLEWTGYHVKELDQKSMRLLVPPELHADLDVERQRALEGDAQGWQNLPGRGGAPRLHPRRERGARDPLHPDRPGRDPDRPPHGRP
jgi:PAS domain-containing protein